MSAAIFAIGITGLYGVSAMYHRGRWSVPKERLMRHLDHSMIFVLIAASYTPITLLALRPATGITLLVLAWVGVMRVGTIVPLAVLGFVGQGIVRPNVVQGALEPLPDAAGVASALMSAAQMVTGATASALVSMLFDGRSAHSMASVMAVCACAAAAVYAFVVRPAEARSTAHRGGAGVTPG